MRFGPDKQQPGKQPDPNEPGWGVPEGERQGTEPPSPYPADYFADPDAQPDQQSAQDGPNPYLEFDAHGSPAQRTATSQPRDAVVVPVFPGSTPANPPTQSQPPPSSATPSSSSPSPQPTFPGLTSPGPPTTATRPRRRWGRALAWLAVAAVLAIGGVVLLRVLPGDGPPPLTAPATELDPAWTSPIDAAIYWDIDGFGDHDSPVVTAGDAAVVRVGDQTDTATGVVAVTMVSGRQLWSFDLPAAWCAEVTLLVGGREAVACAGEGRVVVLDASDGSVLMETALAWDPQRIAASPEGIVVVGPSDPESGSTVVAWVGLDGAVAWETDLAEDPGFLNSLYRNEDGVLEPWEFDLAQVPTGVAFAHDGVAYFASQAGLGSPFDCRTIWVGTDGYACPESYSGPTVLRTWQGQEVWGVNAGLVSPAQGWQVPTMFAEPNYNSRTQEVLVIDPVTGDPGAPVVDMTSGSFPSVLGTADITLLEYEEELMRVAPNGEVLWRVPIEAYHARSVVVAGDRLIVPGPDDANPMIAYVVDADDGGALAEVDWELTMCDPVGERQVLCLDYRSARLYNLP